jgi:hypothetical protein
MSMASVYHVFEKSQAQGSRRVLVLTVAIHANECCGVAWPSDTTLRREVNVSRQRIHELKNTLEEQGELVIIERPGATNLYFIADQGKPVGLDVGMLLDAKRSHERGCPLRDAAEALRVAKLLFEPAEPEPAKRSAPVHDGVTIALEVMQAFGIRHTTENWPPTQQTHGRADASPPVDNAAEERRGVSDPPDPQGSEIPDGGCQESLTQKTSENERENNVVNVASHRSKSHLPPLLSDREEDLAREIARHLDEDGHSLAATRRIVGGLGTEIAYRLFHETMEQEEAQKIKTTPGRYFIDLAKREAVRQGVDLGFRTDKK